MSITTYAELQTAIGDELSYNPKSGEFVWLKDGRGKSKVAGGLAGCVRPDGYLTIKVNQKQWLAHRLAWVLFYGEKPPRVIDHIDRDKSNNAIKNLRDGTGSVNGMNVAPRSMSPFGVSGVRCASKAGHYQAYVIIRGAFKSLYHGPDFFEACCARKSWEADFWSSVA